MIYYLRLVVSSFSSAKLTRQYIGILTVGGSSIIENSSRLLIKRMSLKHRLATLRIPDSVVCQPSGGPYPFISRASGQHYHVGPGVVRIHFDSILEQIAVVGVFLVSFSSGRYS